MCWKDRHKFKGSKNNPGSFFYFLKIRVDSDCICRGEALILVTWWWVFLNVFQSIEEGWFLTWGFFRHRFLISVFSDGEQKAISCEIGQTRDTKRSMQSWLPFQVWAHKGREIHRGVTKRKFWEQEAPVLHRAFLQGAQVRLVVILSAQIFLEHQLAERSKPITSPIWWLMIQQKIRSLLILKFTSTCQIHGPQLCLELLHSDQRMELLSTANNGR